ncbi:MAG: DUF433 domain-containing protein [Actinomycetota bacterium]|nr:DUF433 domain-containing protein [Actinomycetota bacterium]
MAITEMPPLGYYLAREVGRLAGVSGDRIGQWARRGYIRSSQSSGRPRVYSYQDVAEAMVVHELVLHKVRLSDIKAAISFVRESFGSGWPLSQAVATRSLSVPSGEGQWTEMAGTEGLQRRPPRGKRPRLVAGDTEMGTMAGVLEGVDLHRIVSDLSRGGWAVRELPELEHIEVDPERLSGRPVVRGSRVSAEFAGQLAATTDGRALLRDEYELTDDEIEDARRWWGAVQRYEQAA